MVKIAFFEVESWEKDYLKSNLKNNIFITSDKLTVNNVDKFKSYDIISTFINSKIDKNILDKLKNLKLIVTRSTGYDHINLEECKKRNIKISYVPSYGENTVAEHTFGLILMLSRKLHKAFLETKSGGFDFHGLQGFDLKGKILGVVGTGNIGKHVIRIAKGFEMNVIAFDVNKDNKLAKKLNFKYTSFNELLKKADIVTLHVPYNKHTHHMINLGNIKLFKKGSLLINTARGNLIQTEALLYGLDKKILNGIGLDVLEDEKLIKEERELITKDFPTKDIKIMLENHILAEQDNVIITPHNAFNSKEAITRILETTISNIKHFLKRKPINIVI